ncbi:MAG: hypothetical protein M3Y35_07405, partial [Actinomycetota bacterium]|nr:hypothetical protein [Actinomycetota bacterium]
NGTLAVADTPTGKNADAFTFMNHRTQLAHRRHVPRSGILTAIVPHADPVPGTVRCSAGLRDDRPVNAVSSFVTHWFAGLYRDVIEVQLWADEPVRAHLVRA